jgi:hypothetical protein
MTVAGALAALLFVAQPCSADFLVTMKSQSEARPELGVAAAEETSTTWIGENKLRENTGNRSIIVDLNSKKLYILKHDSRTFHELDLPVDILATVPDGMREMVDQFIAQMQMEVEIEPTEEEKEIAGYKTKKYTIHVTGGGGMEMTVDQWMTNDVDFDVAAFKTLMSAVLSAQPMGAEWFKEVLAIKGYPVLAETTVKIMGEELKKRDELVSVEEKECPEGNYAPAGDYEYEPFDFMKILQEQSGI